MVSSTSYTIRNVGNSTVSTSAIDTDAKDLASSALVSWDLQKTIRVPELQKNGCSTYYKPKNNSQGHQEAVVTSAVYPTITVIIQQGTGKWETSHPVTEKL